MLSSSWGLRGGRVVARGGRRAGQRAGAATTPLPASRASRSRRRSGCAADRFGAARPSLSAVLPTDVRQAAMRVFNANSAKRLLTVLPAPGGHRAGGKAGRGHRPSCRAAARSDSASEIDMVTLAHQPGSVCGATPRAPNGGSVLRVRRPENRPFWPSFLGQVVPAAWFTAGS